MELTRWDVVLWISGYIGYICLMTVLLVKKRYKTFPWFTLFLANELIQDPLLALIQHYGSDRLYGYSFWSLDLLDSVLLIAVIFELAKGVARAINERKRVFRSHELFWLVASLLFIGVMCWLITPSQSKPVITLAIKVATMSTVIMCGLTIYVFMAVFFYGVRFRVHSVAITYGLTAYVLTRMLVYLSVVNTGSSELLQKLWTWSRPLYILMLFVWSFMLWLEEPERKLSTKMHALLLKMRSIERVHAE
jgi:hypothetical protein